MALKKCVNCTKEIGRHDYWHNTPAGPTCSAKCRDAAKR